MTNLVNPRGTGFSAANHALAIASVSVHKRGAPGHPRARARARDRCGVVCERRLDRDREVAARLRTRVLSIRNLGSLGGNPGSKVQCRGAETATFPPARSSDAPDPLSTAMDPPPGALSLGIDVGTQSTKAVLYNIASDVVVARASCPHAILSPAPGWAEQDPLAWRSAVVAATRAALSKAAEADGASSCGVGDALERVGSRVVGVAVSGQQHGLVSLDASGAPLCHAPLWCDVRCSAQARRLREAFGDPSIGPSTTASKILWMKEHQPRMYAAVGRFALPHDYVNAQLIGECLAEPSDASGTGLLLGGDQKPAWDDARISLLDPDDPSRLRARLPELIVDPDAPIGRLTASAAAELGLPAGIPVAPGGGDNAMSALSAGALDPSVAVVSLGTSGTVFLSSQGAVPASAPGGICRFRDAAGWHLPLSCTMSCAEAVTEVAKGLAGMADIVGRNIHQLDPLARAQSGSHAAEKDRAMNAAEPSVGKVEEEMPAETQTDDIAEDDEGRPANVVSRALLAKLDAMALLEPPGCGGVAFLPFFRGERTPDLPQARGALVGMRPGDLRPGVLYRAAMEGVLFLLVDALEQLLECTGNVEEEATEVAAAADGASARRTASTLGPADPASVGAHGTLQVVGGMAASRLARTVLADATGRRVVCASEPDAAARGAALQAAAVALGRPVRAFCAARAAPDTAELGVDPTLGRKETYDAHRARNRRLARALWETEDAT